MAGPFGRHALERGHFNEASARVSVGRRCVYLTYADHVVTNDLHTHPRTRRPHRAAAASFQSSPRVERVPRRENLPA